MRGQVHDEAETGADGVFDIIRKSETCQSRLKVYRFVVKEEGGRRWMSPPIKDINYDRYRDDLPEWLDRSGSL